MLPCPSGRETVNSVRNCAVNLGFVKELAATFATSHSEGPTMEYVVEGLVGVITIAWVAREFVKVLNYRATCAARLRRSAV